MSGKALAAGFFMSGKALAAGSSVSASNKSCSTPAASALPLTEAMIGELSQ